MREGVVPRGRGRARGRGRLVRSGVAEKSNRKGGSHRHC